MHLSTLDSYTYQAREAGDESVGDLLADALIEEIMKHEGPVYIVDQGWSLGRRESRPRARILEAIQGRPIEWIRFDENTDDWDEFEHELIDRLRQDKIKKVAVGGIWYQDDFGGGCATELFLILKKYFPTQVIDRILGKETDIEEIWEEENED